MATDLAAADREELLDLIVASNTTAVHPSLNDQLHSALCAALPPDIAKKAGHHRGSSAAKIPVIFVNNPPGSYTRQQMTSMNLFCSVPHSSPFEGRAATLYVYMYTSTT